MPVFTVSVDLSYTRTVQLEVKAKDEDAAETKATAILDKLVASGDQDKLLAAISNDEGINLSEDYEITSVDEE